MAENQGHCRQNLLTATQKFSMLLAEPQSHQIHGQHLEAQCLQTLCSSNCKNEEHRTSPLPPQNNNLRVASGTRYLKATMYVQTFDRNPTKTMQRHLIAIQETQPVQMLQTASNVKTKRSILHAGQQMSQAQESVKKSVGVPQVYKAGQWMYYVPGKYRPLASSHHKTRSHHLHI